VRYWVWFSASCKFLVPFALLVGLGGLVPSTPSKRVARDVVPFAVEQIAQPFPEALPIAPASRHSIDGLSLVWSCGFAAVVWVRFRGWLRVRAAVRASTPADIPASVEVRASPGLLEPGVVGLWRPTLLLPAGITDRLTPPQLEAVLAHELCHVRRRDNLFAAIHMAVEALFWFHPLVWWIGARLVEERERACDEEVLRLGSAPHDYAEAILSVCKHYVESPLVCVSGVTGADLKRRIESIMTNRTARRLTFTRKAALAAAATAALAAPIVVGVLQAPLSRAQSPGDRPKFEVASVKSCKVGEVVRSSGQRKGGGPPIFSPGTLSTGCSTVEELIRNAYVQYATGVLIRDPSSPPLSGGLGTLRPVPSRRQSGREPEPGNDDGADVAEAARRPLPTEDPPREPGSPGVYSDGGKGRPPVAALSERELHAHRVRNCSAALAGGRLP
jgi:beta-lactamase regulating signal transducer with metallopeptidase domain